MQDINNSRVAEDELAQLRQRVDELQAQAEEGKELKTLGRFASGIAHDFNNLLTGVLGSADLALSELAPDSPLLVHLREIVNSARRATTLTQQMLAYSGKSEYLFEPTDISSGIEAMAHLIEASVSEKVRISYDLASFLPEVDADLQAILQVIINLATNASQALGDHGGIVFITTGVMECDRAYLSQTSFDDNLRDGYYVYIDVSDTGRGMDKDTCEMVFDPEFTTKHMGRGLGLATVLRITRAHKGAIKVYSEPGQGTTVKVLLPSSQRQVTFKSDLDIEKGDWRGDGVILIVDDDEGLRRVTGDMLRSIGFNVLEASNGLEGIDVFTGHKDEITAVLLDLSMPELGGEDTFNRIRAIKEDIPVILTSGYDEQMVMELFKSEGISGFIQKPLVLKSLKSELRRVLEN